MLKNYGKLFRALSDEHRLEIIDLLLEKTISYPDDKRISAAVLLEKFPFSQPTLSHHMKILCESNLVVRYKIGKYIYYTLDSSGLRRFGEFIELLNRV
jgi:ArsR family transcriptional regulator